MKHDLEQTKKHFDEAENLDFIFFWGHTENKNHITKACLSQWYESDFTINDIIYFTAEHYMMAEKAKLFNNIEIHDEILITKKQGKVKELGRQITNFKQEVWDAYKYQIVVEGNFHKFKQNEKLKTFLLNTKNQILVEASPVDNIWGIGLSAENQDAKNPYLWKGENLLGFALMEVRDLLK